jgi:hypothetical protein
MKAVVRLAAIAVLLAALSSAISAQWPEYPSGTVPKNAKGEPNMDAPAPRTADGKPDFSGLWRGAPTGGRGNPAPVAPPGTPPLALFANIGRGYPGGLPIQPWAAELLKKRMADNSKDNPEAFCLPMGLMQFHTQGFPRKFIQTPKLMVILYEASSGIRQIFTDGRKLPDNDPQPWFYGYSVGRWEGDTLVVETSGFRDDGWLDINGTPMTDKAKMTERFRARELRADGDRHHRGRSQGVYQAVDRQAQPGADAGPGADRVHLRGEPAIRAAARTGASAGGAQIAGSW